MNLYPFNEQERADGKTDNGKIIEIQYLNYTRQKERGN